MVEKNALFACIKTVVVVQCPLVFKWIPLAHAKMCVGR